MCKILKRFLVEPNDRPDPPTAPARSLRLLMFERKYDERERQLVALVRRLYRERPAAATVVEGYAVLVLGDAAHAMGRTR